MAYIHMSMFTDDTGITFVLGVEIPARCFYDNGLVKETVLGHPIRCHLVPDKPLDYS